MPTTQNQQYNSTAPLYADLINDEPDFAVASPLYGDQSFKAGLVTIPESNVFLDESTSPPPSHLHSSTAPHTGNMNTHSYTTTSSPSAVVLPVATTTVGSARPTGHRRRHGRVSPKNAHLPPQVLDFKEKRKGRTIASAWAGGAIGLFTIGPLGAVVGAYGGYAAAKTVGKTRERNLIKKYQEQGTVGSPGVAIASPVQRGVMS